MAEDIPDHLAYIWDLRTKKVEKTWLPTIVPPSSFRAVADKVAKEKALRAKQRKGIIKP
jgi:hypothetical protein